MNTFTASNGINVWIDQRGELLTNRASTGAGLCEDTQAKREFFQHERDEELGRWRHGDIVVYPVDSDGDHPMFHEPTSERAWFGPGWTFERDRAYEERFAQAERAYIEAHSGGKTWENAKPGEHWELTAEGKTLEYVAVLAHGNRGEYTRLFPIADVNAVTLGAQATVITAGRRIWPEEDAS